MVGDVNLFLYPSEESKEHTSVTAELEIMVAEAAQRRRGYASEAVTKMMAFGKTCVVVRRLFLFWW